jgi:hypothetical protein
MVVSEEFDDGCDVQEEGDEFISDGQECHFSLPSFFGCNVMIDFLVSSIASMLGTPLLSCVIVRIDPSPWTQRSEDVIAPTLNFF